MDELVRYFVENTIVGMDIQMCMEIADSDKKTIESRLIKPMVKDLSDSVYSIEPQKIINLMQLMLNRIDGLTNEDKLKLTGIYNLKQQLNSIPHPEITFYDFYSHILNYWTEFSREPFRHPNGWIIRIKLRDYFNKDMTYDNFKGTCIRVYFSYSTIADNVMNCHQNEVDKAQAQAHAQQEIEIKGEKLKKICKLSGMSEYFDYDDCRCGEFEPLFEWFNANTPSVLLD